MLRPTRAVYALMLAAVMATSAKPIAAQTVQECYKAVLGWCSDAMENANFIQKFAIGEVCSFMLVGCTGSNIINFK